MQQNDYQKKRRKALPEFISVISHSNCAKIRIEDIEVIEQDGRKIRVVTADKDYTFYGSLSKIAETLVERAFFRPIKSVIINLDHVDDISPYSVNFSSGLTLSLGKNALAMTKRAYKKYLLRYPPYTIWEPISVPEAFVAESGAEDEKGGYKERKSEEKK